MIPKLWRPHYPLPKLRPDEAKKAAVKLYKWLGGIPPKNVKLTSGNRATWIRDREYGAPMLMVNAAAGWAELVHDIGHLWWNRRLGYRGHSEEHARLEVSLVEHVLESGWLEGKLHREKPPPPSKLEKARLAVQRLDAAKEREEKRHARNVKALRTRAAKARRSLAYYEKKTGGAI